MEQPTGQEIQREKRGTVRWTSALVIYSIAAGLFAPATVVLSYAFGEAVMGDKEPMMYWILGLVLGVMLSTTLIKAGVFLVRWKLRKTFIFLFVVVTLIDCAALPVTRWMIAAAQQSPSGTLELW